ncbi:vam6/Vps39-like protein isoform X1 [Argopecten irradians]|uniref:vam6/Vps39-like protein isoform X1 n=1 Tax=Argopecten irradians TaxID=31199 RepID=UPI00371594D2
MHDAYEAIPILEKLPLKIESIACYDDTLLVGTKECHLLQYKVKRLAGADQKAEVKLERSYKNFARKPILQLAVVPELFLLISLSDNIINVHELSTFGQITCLSKTKGATLFAIGVQRTTSLSGEVACTLRLSVAIKRKIQTYYWKNRDFMDLQPDFNMYDVPRDMVWCKDTICVGFKRDYFIVKINKGDTKELFPVGTKQQDPIVTRLENDTLLLGRDEMSILIDDDGNPIQKYPITWTDIPIQIENHPPYLIALLPKHVEIRTISPRLLIQNIDLQKARYICQGSGCIYVASSNFVWKLNAMPIAYQIRQLLEANQFELALHLADMTEEPDDEKQTRINRIKTLHAFNLFCERKFEDSMNIFVKLGTDPSHVIGLYPNLLPNEYRSQLEYPKRPPELEGGDLEKGLLALQDYLTQKRVDVCKDINKEVQTTAIKEGNKTIKSKRQLSQIIDTTLLKCYLQTNDALVAPLLRIKDNNCHVEESEKILKRKEKFSELIILYEKKGLHQKALNLLMNQAARPSSPLKGHDRTVQYLQQLGQDHLDLIFEYAEWVLKQHPEDGLKIFTEDLTEVDSLPREKVFKYLEKTAKDLAIPYLEHVIVECDDHNPDFHNALAQLLRDKVQTLMADYIQSLPEGHLPSKAGQEQGELGEYRRKLINFLQMSHDYVPERLLTRFPLDSFYEERAILLGINYGMCYVFVLIGFYEERAILLGINYGMCYVFVLIGFYEERAILLGINYGMCYVFVLIGFYEERAILLGINYGMCYVLVLIGFYEERAILLGRLGRHELALGIYVHILHDTPAAERYCQEYFERNREENKDVYLDLLKMYLQPPSSSALGISAGQGFTPKPSMEAALRLMKEHAPKIDSTKALELLPATTRIEEILNYLESVMEHQATVRRKNQVLKSMFYAENLQVHEQTMFYHKNKVVINEEKMCKVCKKRIGNSAFARYPSGMVVHYFCCKDPKVNPLEK